MNRISHIQEWEQKAVEAKEKYGKLLKDFEANGGNKDTAVGKKRKGVKKAAPIKKNKKKNDSEDDDDEEEESD